MNKFLELEITVAGFLIKVLTHFGPHIDEAAAMAMAVLRGNKEWLMKHCPNGILYLGILGKEFDEHRLPWEQRREECTATLVARSLGIVNDPAWRNVLRFTLMNDNSGRKNPRDIAEVLKIMNYQHPDPDDEKQEELMNWAYIGAFVKLNDIPNRDGTPFNRDFTLERVMEVAKANPKIVEEAGANMKYMEDWLKMGSDALDLHEKRFQEAKEEFAALCEQGKAIVRSFQGKKVVAVESDNYRMVPYLLSAVDKDRTVIIVKKSRGQVHIRAQKSGGLDLTDAVAIIRHEERCRRGTTHPIDPGRLRMVGTIPESPEWHYFLDTEGKKFAMLMNGSYSYPDTDPTRIPLRDLVGMVMVGIDTRCFHPQFAENCHKGICEGKECHWYAYGLRRCQSAVKKNK